jgi:hypothetical protein
VSDSDLDDMLPKTASATSLAQAQQRFSAGKVAASNGDFSSAGTAFQQAQHLLEGALQADPSEQGTERLRRELATVASIVALAERAEEDRAQGQRDLAIAALDDATGQVKRLRGDARVDGEVVAAIEALRLAINGELKRIASEEQQLAKGDQLLAQKRLDQAAARFRAACDALLPETRSRAEASLRRVEEELQSFESDIRQAQKEADSHTAAEHWQRAYDRWPSGHGVLAGLVEWLGRAGESALAIGQEQAAREYFERALKLKPNDQRAGEGRRQLERFVQLRLSIAQLRDEFDQAMQSSGSETEIDRSLRDQLAQLLKAADDLPALQREITALAQEIDQRQGHIRALLVADATAAQQAALGDWDAAMRLHAAALADMGAPPPPPAVRRHASWQEAHRAITAARREGGQLLAAAQVAYDDGRSADDFNSVIAPLEQAELLIASAGQIVQVVGAPLPDDLLTLSDTTDTLRRRAEAARQSLSEPTIRQGLSGVREAIRVLGEDATLRRIAEHLSSQHSRQAPELLLLAQQAEEQDALDDALDYLRQAREIDPDLPHLAERLEQIIRRRRLEEALRRAEVDAEVAGGSVTAVRGALRQALEVFLLAEYAIPGATRTTIRELLRLGDEDVGEALANPAKWQRARELRDQLLNRESWADKRASQISEQWLGVAREAALRGAITSLAQIGDVLGSYRTAFNYRRIYQSEEAIRFLERAQEALRLSLTGQADRLLDRASKALDRGEYATALDNLNRLDQDYYAPIEREFAHLLDTLDENQEISESRREATELRANAEQLQQQAESIKQALEQAHRAFAANQFTEARHVLQTINHNDKLSSLKQVAETLSLQIERARKQRADRQLEEYLARARTTIKADTNLKNLEELLVALEQATQIIDWEALTLDDRSRLDEAIDHVSEARSNCAAVAEWEADASEARRRGNYEQALRSLRHAIDITQPGGKRARLQAEFDELDGHMRRRRLQDEAIQIGRQLLSKEQYDGALDSFAQAQSFGADVENLQKTARAGELLQSVRAAWSGGKDLITADANLHLASQLAQDNPEATLIAQELLFYQPRFKQRIDEVQRAVQAARTALAQDDLDAAEIALQSALDGDATHTEALRLQRDIHGRATSRADDARFRTLIERVEQERGRGNDRIALRLLEDALALRPDDPIAVNLQPELGREQEANALLRQARDAIYNGKFIDARRLIQAANENASPTLLREVQRLLEDLEAAYRANTVYPIRDLLRDERYREALRRCNEALKQVESDMLRADLVDLGANIVRRWIEKSGNIAQNKLHAADEEAAFLEIAADLQALKAELAAFPESQQIETHIRQVHIGRLTSRLDRVDIFLRQRVVSGLIRASDQPVERAAGDSVSGTPHTLVEARQWTSDVLQEAELLNFDRLSARTRSIQEAITEQERLEQERDARLDRDAKLEQARLLIERARDRRTAELADEDLAHSRELVQAVRRSERFRQDSAVTKMLDQVDAERAALRETREEILRSEQSLGQGHFNDAKSYLQLIQVVYPLLQPRYDQLSTLLDLLTRAEELDGRNEWREAYRSYREAAQHELAPDTIIRSRIERCQRHITEQVFLEARAALRALPPNPAQARALLEAADTAGWLHASASLEIDSLRTWILSRQRIVEALALLDPTHAEPIQALNLLRDARRLHSDPESDDQLEQWTSLAQALHDWKSGNLDVAYQSLSKIRPPVAAMPYVRTAQQIVREQMLVNLRDQTRRAITIWDPVAAIQTIERGLLIASDDVELRRLGTRQQQILQRAAEIRREMEAGWQVLEREHEDTSVVIDWSRYQLAQAAFERVVGIDEQFSEADHWRQYAQSMVSGLREAKDLHYENAARHLEAAGHILEAGIGEVRPILLGDSARQQARRRQASAVAAQLAEATHELDRLYRDLDEYERRQAPEPVLATIKEIQRQEQAFVGLSRSLVVAPLDMGNQQLPPPAAKSAGNLQSTAADSAPAVGVQQNDQSHDSSRQAETSDAQE